MAKAGYFGYRVQLDATGNEVERHYLDGNGQPFRSPVTGNFGTRQVRNARGNVEEEIFLDAVGEPASEGLARVHHRYDEYAREIERRSLRADGKPVEAPDTGCSIFRSDYNSINLLIAERCLDGEGRPPRTQGHRLGDARDPL